MKSLAQGHNALYSLGIEPTTFVKYSSLYYFTKSNVTYMWTQNGWGIKRLILTSHCSRFNPIACYIEQMSFNIAFGSILN